MLNWANRFNIFCFLDSQDYKDESGSYDCLLATGSLSVLKAGVNSFNEIDGFLENKEWVFGHLSYELKKEFFPAGHLPTTRITFPEFFFFQPEMVIAIRGSEVLVYGEDADKVFQIINEQPIPVNHHTKSFSLQQELSKEEYVSIIQKLREHIQAGDCYEINFCQEFFAEDVRIDPLSVYNALSATSAAPFAGFYRIDDHYLVSASPERFLARRGNELIAQPMKGTLRRSGSAEENIEKEKLRNDPKERSENVMIVDLMRNDLSRVCKKGTVEVKELFGVYTFPQVYQMVSTIRGELDSDTGFYKVIQACFPMGSMTGAPKYKVIELIEKYETSARGIFSGCLGYFHNGDFDFNVVIRSLMYNASGNYLSLKTGSGITIYSDPEKEWEECLLKAAGIKKVLEDPALSIGSQ
jgi:para-aminobenzoate synthetase component I